MNAPAFLPNSQPSDSPPSEKAVFEALQASLGPGWTVFSSVNWTYRNSKGKFRDGEADYILFHPSFGLLVLEVKGGRPPSHPVDRAVVDNSLFQNRLKVNGKQYSN